MANLGNYAQTIPLYFSTAANANATGLAAGIGSTAGSSGTGVSTSSPGGMPSFSTAINSSVSLAGCEGIRFTCIPQNFSTAGGAGTSGIFSMQVYATHGTTDDPANWIIIKDAYTFGYSTGGGSMGAGSTLNSILQVDVYRPKLSAGLTALSAVVQIPSSSCQVVLFADRYGFRNDPRAGSTFYNGNASAISTGAVVVNVNGTT